MREALICESLGISFHCTLHASKERSFSGVDNIRQITRWDIHYVLQHYSEILDTLWHPIFLRSAIRGATYLELG